MNQTFWCYDLWIQSFGSNAKLISQDQIRCQLQICQSLPQDSHKKGSKRKNPMIKDLISFIKMRISRCKLALLWSDPSKQATGVTGELTRCYIFRITNEELISLYLLIKNKKFLILCSPKHHSLAKKKLINYSLWENTEFVYRILGLRRVCHKHTFFLNWSTADIQYKLVT